MRKSNHINIMLPWGDKLDKDSLSFLYFNWKESYFHCGNGFFS